MKKAFVIFCFLLSFNYFSALPIFSQTPSGNKENDHYPLVVYIRQEMVRPPGEAFLFQRGVPSRVVFAVENKGDAFVVLRDVNILNQLPDIDQWYGAIYGSLEYKPLEEIWRHHELIQMLSKPVCAKGVVPPGRTLKVVRWLVLKDPQIHLEMTYQRLSKEEVKKNMYFFIDSGGRESPLRRTYQRPETIDSLVKARVDWSLVIFPQADQFPSYKQKLSCQATLSEPEFSLNEARRAIGGQILDFVFWKSKKGWVFKTDKDIFWVTKDKTLSLPEIDLLAFILIESSRECNFILPLKGYEGFDARKPKIEGPGYFNPGVTPLPQERIVALFEFVRIRGDSIKVFPYDPDGLGKRFYLLVGQFDERLRKEIAGKK